MIDLVDKNHCSGCASCALSCPGKAIIMSEDSEGFLFPKIDETKCSKCGLCKTVCPVLNPNQERKPLATYAAKHTNKKSVLKSSSGGVFIALADEIIAQNGVVFGAKFNDEMEVIHDFAETTEELALFQGSKYVQSNIGESYIKVKQFLDAKRLVLFSGTPCQIAGLKGFLQKEYENLITVDLICHGVPSPKIWKKYLTETIKNYKKIVPDIAIKNLSFREKKEGWLNFNFSLNIFSKTLNKNFEIISETHHSNVFMRLFLENLILRKSCYNCPFKSLKSGSDITIGDFWGIQHTMPDFYDKNGVSAILLNSIQGVNFYKNLSSLISRETSFDAVVKNNSMLIKSVPKPKERENVFEKLNSSAFEDFSFSKLATKTPKKIGVLTFPLRTNYGGILQAYALMTVLKLMGHAPILINKRPLEYKIPLKQKFRAVFRQIIKKYLFFQGDSWAYLSLKMAQYRIFLNKLESKYTPRYVQPFVDKYLQPKTKKCFTSDSLLKQSKNLDVVIVGSDQIWRRCYDLNYFCDFLQNTNIKRISYAASFGTAKWELPEEQTQKCKDLIKKFSAVSVRESDGVQKCEEYFNKNALRVLDPTLLLKKEHYENLIKNTKSSQDSGILQYILDINDEKASIAKFISTTLGKKIVIANSRSEDYNSAKFSLEDRVALPVENWITGFSNADFVFTDSFHGCVFSIIFNKPFIVFINENRGNARFSSLLEMFDLTSRIILSKSDLTHEKILEPIDWKRVNTILEIEKEKSLNFLRNNL